MLFLCSYYGFSQQYPVQVTTTLVPPYSLYLSDYTAIGSNNLQVLVNLLELDRPNLQIKFRITIEGAGITLRTSPAFMPRPLNIQGGVPELFTGADLTSYFNPDHMDFTGITRAAFKRSGQLPEGFYTFTLEVVEYNRNVRISNQSVSYAWIVLNDPPLLNTPFNGDKLIATDPQNIMFSWTPRHAASPNAAFSTEYEFRMVELYPGQTNPDIAIRSSNSIYTTTTNLTSLNYGIIEPMLIPGKKYAFRVRAYDTSGRDLFKNDGYSETYVFQYGDACETFEGIAAKTLDPQRARISWEPEQHHTGCVINYRKNGKEDWFTQEVNGSYGIVAQLAGRTTYEYQLIPQCGTILGEKSPVMTFTTPEVDESGFVCGAPIPEFDASDVPLMKPLLPLDVIQVGDWTVNLLNVTANGDGTYGGAGYAAVPNFNLANVRVVFDRILVNEDYQVVAGDIKTIYSEDSRFVLDIKKKEEEPEVVEGPESTDTELTENLVADVLAVEIPADIGEVVFSGGLLEVYDESGNLIEDTDLDLPPAGEELTITDSNGDTWVVDSEGVVREGHVSEASTPESSEVDVIVQFKPTEESSYGLDTYNPDIPQLRHYYQNILTINDEEYVPAWKSVPVGMPDQVIAMAGENEFPENMKFRSSTVDLEPMAGQQDNEKNLSVIGKAHGDVDVIEAYQSIEDEEQVAGRIHVVSYEKIYKTLEIVPVNGASIGDIHTIGDRVNEIFQQAAVEWKVEAAEPFTIDPDLLENFDEGESGMLASFPDKMQRFNREFKRSRPVDKETYYIFLIDEGSASLSGFMPFKRQFGYVFTKNTSYTNKTIAHELAHGAFRLRHTFSSTYGIPQRSTDNLMDYNGDHDRLKKFQWDLIHDPENLVGWFEDDEESALNEIESTSKATIYFVSNNDAWFRKAEYPYTAIVPNPPDTPKLAQGTQVSLVTVVKGKNKTKEIDVAKFTIEGNTGTKYTAYSNLAKVVDLSEEIKYKIEKDCNALKLPYTDLKTEKSYKKDDTFLADKMCGTYVRVKSEKDLEGDWIALSVVKRAPDDDTNNFNWMTDVSLDDKSSITSEIRNQIIKNRSMVNDRSDKDIYGNNRLKKIGGGNYYIGNSKISPTFSGTDFEIEVKMEIYNEIGKEGGIGAINTYDSEIFTFGKGFAVKGLLMDVIDELLKIKEPNYTQIFANAGIIIVNKNFWVLDNEGNWRKDDSSSKSYAASSYIASNSHLVDFFIELAEKDDYTEDVLNAQVNTFSEKGAGKYPSHIINSEKTAYSDNWSHQSVTVIAHLSHWAGASWSDGKEIYKDTKGDLDKILYTYLYTSVRNYKSLRVGSIIDSKIYRWNTSYNVLDRLNQFSNPKSAGLTKMNNTWSSHSVKLEFKKDKNEILRAKKSEELKYVTNEGTILIKNGADHIVITKDASIISYEIFEDKEK